MNPLLDALTELHGVTIDTSAVRLALLVLFEEAWPLECWVANCARPRIGDVYCALHAPQAARHHRGRLR